MVKLKKNVDLLVIFLSNIWHITIYVGLKKNLVFLEKLFFIFCLYVSFVVPLTDFFY